MHGGSINRLGLHSCDVGCKNVLAALADMKKNINDELEAVSQLVNKRIVGARVV